MSDEQESVSDARDVTIRQQADRLKQLAWRIVDGKAVYVCYHIYDLPDSPQRAAAGRTANQS